MSASFVGKFSYQAVIKILVNLNIPHHWCASAFINRDDNIILKHIANFVRNFLRIDKVRIGLSCR